jgi:hypothetical protein
MSEHKDGRVRELERWTIHVCEDHRVQDCSLCGVFDVISVVRESTAQRTREALRALLTDIEDFGEPRRHEAAMTLAREALEAGER